MGPRSPRGVPRRNNQFMNTIFTSVIYGSIGRDGGIQLNLIGVEYFFSHPGEHFLLHPKKVIGVICGCPQKSLGGPGEHLREVAKEAAQVGQVKALRHCFIFYNSFAHSPYFAFVRKNSSMHV